MNILFYHGDETCPTMGGIQRTTAVVASGLAREYGHHCYNIYDYEEPYPVDVPRYKYIDSRRLRPGFTADELAPLLKQWKIDVVVNQMMPWKNQILRQAIDRAGIDCRLLYFHHTTPKRLWDTSMRGALKAFAGSRTPAEYLRRVLRIVGLPLYRFVFNKKTIREHAELYRRIYRDVHRFVLLSANYTEEWVQMTGVTDLSRLRAIPNALSFDVWADEKIFLSKEKRVLIVARMTEFPKQIIMALKMWKKITREKDLDDWRLDIVGSGADLDMFKAYAQSHGIGRVTFHGRRESQPFYEKSLIFIMTSVREGWAMTLNEAQQLGVVPVAFDSFGAVRDIISDGENGFLVRPFDRHEYIEKLKLLMRDEVLRHRMAANAVRSSERYAIDKVLAMWQGLLTEN